MTVSKQSQDGTGWLVIKKKSITMHGNVNVNLCTSVL